MPFPQQNKDSLRKKDIPFLSRGAVAVTVSIGIPLVVITASFCNPGRDMRPGIIDSLICGSLGLATGCFVGKSAHKHWTRYFTNWKEFRRKYGPLTHYLPGYDIGLSFRDLLPGVAFIAVMYASAAIGWILNILGTGWPLVGGSPTVTTSICTFICSFLYQYIRWYNNLPD